MLINCPECGKEMSSEAKQCIHCGFPIQNYLKRREQEKLKQIKEEVRLIDLACQPLTSDKETSKQQRLTRFQYEQSLYRIKKRREQTQQRKGRAVSI